MTRLLAIAIGSAVITVAAVGYLAASGAGLGAPSVFVVLAALVLCLTVYLIARSGIALLREPEAEEVRRVTGRRRKELEREKQSLLKALKDLEFDHEMGKVGDGDFAEIAGRYRGRTIQVMRQLDETGADLRKLLERDLAERMARGRGEASRRGERRSATTTTTTGAGATAAGGAPATTATTATTATMATTASLGSAATTETTASLGSAATAAAVMRRPLCGACETENDPDAVFCKRCGKPVGAAEAR